MQLANGQPHTIASDSSWHACTTADERWLDVAWQPHQPWQQAVSFGAVDAELWPPEAANSVRILELDDYTQWKQALGTDGGTDPSTFFVPPGFEIQLLRSAAPGEGSWISLEFDPQGRIIIAREDRGLVRITLPDAPGGETTLETIDKSLEECRGLLFAHGALYVNANNSMGLYRLRDSDADDTFDEITLLYTSGGGVGHGRNDLALGPDGAIYSMHGDSVDLPRNLFDRTSPFREQRRGASTSEGHLLRFAPDGSAGEVVASGLRNPYGIDFNADGELFTYDADAEYDMGAPWYRPTRVDQLVSGADFGWRGVTGAWPPYYPDHPDNAQPTLDIGKGSPTAVKFGSASQFPPLYQRALFILDWAYGRIIAVHLLPRGAGYYGRAETFLRGRPLNVTDLTFGGDGAMYFVTGGRQTQSGLYRLRYTGAKETAEEMSPQRSARQSHARQARALRRELESFHGQSEPRAVEAAWPHLDNPDPLIRYAARLAVEHQPPPSWRARALSERRPLAAVTGLLALARNPDEKQPDEILNTLNDLPLEEFGIQEQLAALHVYHLCLPQQNGKQLDRHSLDSSARKLDGLYPHTSAAMNRELSRLLIELAVPAAVEKTLQLFKATDDQLQRFHYLFVLREARAGWTSDLRRYYFTALGEMHGYQGGEGLPSFIERIEADALASLAPAEAEEFRSLLAEGGDASANQAPMDERPFVRAWQLADLTEALSEVGRGRDFQRGARLFEAALCARCHRVAGRGAAIGPDLTSLASRFSRRDILEATLRPSQVVAEQYRRAQVVTADGRVFSGQILPDRDYRSATLRIAVDPLRPETIVEVPKVDIESHTISETSVMPEGLLNTLQQEEILDLLAFLESAGDPRHPSFRQAD
jgi:putative heme-binding domain-containing protein